MGTTGHEIAVSIILITGPLLTIFGMAVMPISLVNYKPDNEHLFEMYSGIMKRKHSFTSTETSLIFMAFLKPIQLNSVTSYILSFLTVTIPAVKYLIYKQAKFDCLST